MYLRYLPLLVLMACASNRTEKDEWRHHCEEGVCLDITRNEADKSEVFEIISEIPHPVTVTLMVQFSHAAAVPVMNRGQITKVIKPNEVTELLTLEADDKKEDIHFMYKYFWKIGPLKPQHDDNFRYRIPFATGKKILVGQSNYGVYSHFDDSEHAVDFVVPEGTAVHAARGGDVIDVKEDSDEGGADESYVDKANYIRILHSDGTRGHYLHLKKSGSKVKVGQVVKEGEVIGYSGNTGYSTTPHLHFMVNRAMDGRKTESVEVKFKFTGKSKDVPGFEEEVEVVE